MLGTVLVMIMIIKVIIVDCHDFFHIHIDPCEVSMLRTESGHDCDNQVIIVVIMLIIILMNKTMTITMMMLVMIMIITMVMMMTMVMIITITMTIVAKQLPLLFLRH